MFRHCHVRRIDHEPWRVIQIINVQREVRRYSKRTGVGGGQLQQQQTDVRFARRATERVRVRVIRQPSGQGLATGQVRGQCEDVTGIRIGERIRSRRQRERRTLDRGLGGDRGAR